MVDSQPGWIHQLLNAKAAQIREPTDEMSLRLIERAKSADRRAQGPRCADLDTFVMERTIDKKGQSLLVPDIEVQNKK